MENFNKILCLDKAKTKDIVSAAKVIICPKLLNGTVTVVHGGAN